MANQQMLQCFMKVRTSLSSPGSQQLKKVVYLDTFECLHQLRNTLHCSHRNSILLSLLVGGGWGSVIPDLDTKICLLCLFSLFLSVQLASNNKMKISNAFPTGHCTKINAYEMVALISVKVSVFVCFVFFLKKF